MASDLGLHPRETLPGAVPLSAPHRAEKDMLAALAGRVAAAWRGSRARQHGATLRVRGLLMRETPLHLLGGIGLADRSEVRSRHYDDVRDVRPDGVLFRSRTLRH